MVKYAPLDLVIVAGETYYTDRRFFLLVKKIGTDSADPVQLVVDNQPLGRITSLVAPMHVTESNKLGPLALGEHYYVVPPNTKFYVSGPSGAKMRLVGLLGKLEPGEAVPADVMARYGNQGKAYLTYAEATYSHGVDVPLGAGSEVEVLTLTPKTIEKYVLAHPVMVSVANYTPKEGDLALRFYVENAPVDDLLAPPGTQRGGVDVLSAPRPPSDTTEEVPFTLRDTPIEVPGDHTLSVRIRNTSGADITPAAGTSLEFTVTAIVTYVRTG